MKKRIMTMLLLFLGVFVVGFNAVNAEAEIEITCGSTECVKSTFIVDPLNSSNTASGGYYADYAEYYQSYYQSPTHYQEDSNGTTTLLGTYGNEFEFDWSSSTGFVFNGSLNLTEMIGSAVLYQKAGTYAFLVRQSALSTGADTDKTEYVVYVNVKSDLTVGTIAARKVKDAEGRKIAAEKVTELSFALTSIHPVTIYGKTGDFYLLNKIEGQYADLTLTTTYNVYFKGCSESFEAEIVDSTNAVKGIVTFTKNTDDSCLASDVTLGHNQALVVPVGSLKISSSSSSIVNYFGMIEKGYVASSNLVSNGLIVSEDAGALPYFSRYYFELGGAGENYAEYTWTYSGTNVPDTGVNMKVIPYVIIAVLVVVIAVLLLFLLRKKDTSKE